MSCLCAAYCLMLYVCSCASSLSLFPLASNCQPLSIQPLPLQIQLLENGAILAVCFVSKFMCVDHMYCESMFVSQSHQVGPEDVKVEELAPGAEAKSNATPPPSGALHNPDPDIADMTVE